MSNSNLEKQLRESEQQLQSLFHYNTNAIFVLDRWGSFIRVNPAMIDITGYKEEALLTMKYETLVYADKQRVCRYVELALNGQSKTFEIELVHNLGQRLYVNVTVVPYLIEGEIRGVIGIAQDMTKRKMAEDEIKKIANEDELTRLPNRRFFLSALEKAVEHAKHKDEQLAVLFIDLDRFKLVNDTLGHFLGDKALKMVAERLQKGMCNQNLLARMGGDEFVVYLPALLSPHAAYEVATNLLKAIRKPLIINGYQFTLTGSIGISIFPENGDDVESLIRTADAAMYRAKANGSDMFERYSQEMVDEFYELFHLENDLRKALERGEFKLYFQPQFDTKSGKLCGEEVLVRWNHPRQGLVGPNKFISIAEETGLIIPLGEWILREACKQKSHWIHNGFPKVPMSVNVSLRQFLQVNFVDQIQAILLETGLPPQYLDLEVTESVTIDIDRTRGVLKKLTQLGIHISLDDFGTGYSSLQYLSQLPIQELKIDQSFVKAIGKGDNKEAIISMIINLAHLLQLYVIAEGVETVEQLQYLAKHGCDRVQGYLHSKPLSTLEYEKYLRQ